MNAERGKYELNRLVIEKQLEHRTELLSGYPLYLGFDPSNFCNLRCPFCTNHKRRNKEKLSGNMSLIDFKTFIDQAGPYLKEINFGDKNEPLMNRDIYRMIRYFKHNFCGSAKLSTNLNNFEPSDALTLVSSGLDLLCVGAEGTSQESYAKYRIGGSFEKVIKNIQSITAAKETLKSQAPVINWVYVVFKHNETEIPEARKMAKKLGVNIQFTAPAIYSIEENYKEWLPDNMLYRRYSVGHKRRDRGKAVIGYKASSTFCEFPWHTVAVDAKGNLYPCTAEHTRDALMGNVLKEPFDKLWNNRRFRAVRAFIAGEKTGAVSGLPCSSCLAVK